MENRTLYCWSPSAVFAAVCILGGSAAFGVSGNQSVLFGFGFLGLFLGLLFFMRVRFEHDRATLYYCTFFPVTVVYADVTGLIVVRGDPRHPDVPTRFQFLQASGKIRKWDPGFFSASAMKEIRDELEKRIHIPENGLRIPDMQNWVRQDFRIAFCFFCFFGLYCFAVGSWCVFEQVRWDIRVRTWDKTPGILRKNQDRTILDGKRKKTVSDVEYSYTVRGKSYTGTRIVYDSDTFPSLKVGTRRQVIVNPADPRDSAIMFWYLGYWGLIRWLPGIAMYLGSLVFLVLYRIIRPPVIHIPEPLKAYVESIPPAEFFAALDRERPGPAGRRGGIIDIRRPMERPGEECTVFREGRSAFMPYLLILFFLISAGLALKISALFWFAAGMIVLAAYGLYKRADTLVFDFQERMIYFRRGMKITMETVPFSGIGHLSLSLFANTFRLYAVSKQGTMIPLCRADAKRVRHLFEPLAELADKMGRLPVVYR